MGLIEGIPCTMHSFKETQTDLGKPKKPIGVGYASCPTMKSNTNLSMSSAVKVPSVPCFIFCAALSFINCSAASRVELAI